MFRESEVMVRFRSTSAMALVVFATLTIPATACSSPRRTVEIVETPPASIAAVTLSPAVLEGQIREAAVSGSWYPKDPVELTTLIDGLLREALPVDGVPIGLVVPHAGYAFSGPVAAHGFRQLEGAGYEVAVIIASDHQAPISSPISVWAEGGFKTPLGVVPVDAGIAQALVRADARISSSHSAHEGEHPIEIQLPFLQRVCPACSLVPVLMGSSDGDTVQALTKALVPELAGRRAVVIASSDLSHYPTYDDALIVDGATLGAIETGNPAQVEDTVSQMMRTGVSNLATCACGEGPILVVMEVAQALGADTVSILRYANSGDSLQGDRARVVGYGAVMLWDYVSPNLVRNQQEELLSLARTTLEEYLELGAIAAYHAEDPDLQRRSAVFVTLKEGNRLRGCIGRTTADLPLSEAVQQMVVAAGTQDPRFPPLAPDELGSVEVEISILSPFRRLTGVGEVKAGTHGLMILKGGRRGLLLPQVAEEEGWSRQEFLDTLCLKAALPAMCWQEDAELYAFTAVVIRE